MDRLALGFLACSAIAILLIDGSGGQELETSCPPLLPRRVCWASCRGDWECPESEKCCETECGGNVCSRPVTKVKHHSFVKPGSCPEVPKGPWFCSHTCITDADCRGKLKCCRNRCGARACYAPVEEAPLE